MTTPVTLALRNGRVFDAATGRLTAGEVGIAGDRIAAVGPSVGAAETSIDIAGAVVAPGLVDLHAHVFSGQDLGLDADVIGPPSGTTTFVDAGSAGAHLWGAMQQEIATRSTRILALVNIASIGTTSIRLSGELKHPAYADADACVAAMRSRSPAGVKVRASNDVAGEHADAALAAGRRAADELGVPLMVHLGPPPSQIDTILDTLRTGDILTHCFTHFAANGVVRDGRIAASARAARERGVLFDVGHGASGFDVTTARAALAMDFPPDTISTDLHRYSMDHVIDLPAVLTRFLALGLPLEDALRRATRAPAAALGLLDQGIGTLVAGGVADVAVLRVVNDPHTFVDAAGTLLPAPERLVIEHTIRAGVPVFDSSEVSSR